MNDLKNLYQDGGNREFDRNTLAGMRKSLSKCHDVNQALIRKIDGLQAERDRYKLVNTTLTAIITGLAFKGLEILFQALR